MNNKKLVLALVPLLTTGVLAGCNRDRGGSRDVDSSKTQLHVAAVRSGMEDKWIQDLAEKFTAKYKDYSFESGKKGVQVWVDGDKTAYNGDQLYSKIKTDDHEIYFIENAKYNTFINPEKLVVNLKDIVSIKGSSGNQFYPDEKSIIERMDPQFRDAFEKSNGDIYMLPYYESFATFQYDKDVFNNPGSNTWGKSFYFRRSDNVIAANALAADWYELPVVGCPVQPIYDDYDINQQEFDPQNFFCDINAAASERSFGPDGIEGTIDDGLPQTFTEFALLLSVMKRAGFTTPLLGNKTYNYYFADMLASVWANEEGIDNINLNFSWNGTANDLVKIENGQVVKDNGELVLESKTINSKSSALELHRQEGIYRALQFSKLIYGDGTNVDMNYEFTEAQSLFKKTKFNSSARYGLICDGNWFENEMKGTFSKNESDPNHRLNRNFGFFTFPKSTSSKWFNTLGDMTIYNINSSTCFLNKTLETSKANVMEAAKAFFLYANSNEGMSAFTAETSVTRPFEYSITASDQNKIPSYGKDMMELRHYLSDKSGKTKDYNICTTYPLSDLVAANENIVHKYEWNFQLTGLTKEKAIPVEIMINKPEYRDVDKYFVDSYNYTKTAIHA